MQGFLQTTHCSSPFAPTPISYQLSPTSPSPSPKPWFALFLLCWCVNKCFSLNYILNIHLTLQGFSFLKDWFDSVNVLLVFSKGVSGFCFPSLSDSVNGWMDAAVTLWYLFGNVDFVFGCVFVRIFLAVSGVLSMTHGHLFAKCSFEFVFIHYSIWAIHCKTVYPRTKLLLIIVERW